MSTSTSSRRHPSATGASSKSAVPPPPKPPCSIQSSAVISDKAIITGKHLVTIGDGCIIHPFAKISSAVAPVRIGRNVIISERTTVGLVATYGVTEDAVVVIEDNVSIEAGAVVEAARVGAGSVIEVQARLGSRANIGKFCKISSLCSVNDEVPDYTTVFGEASRRTNATVQSRSDVRDLKVKGHLMHIETLKKLIPSNTAKWLS